LRRFVDIQYGAARTCGAARSACAETLDRNLSTYEDQGYRIEMWGTNERCGRSIPVTGAVRAGKEDLSRNAIYPENALLLPQEQRTAPS